MHKGGLAEEVLDRAVAVISGSRPQFPFKLRGIKIDSELIRVTMGILNEAPGKALPQNCSNQVREKSKDGLDRRIKERRDSNLRTANIISDVLSEAGITEVYLDRNARTDRMIKHTKLLAEWVW
ncbi:hypothetical protein N6H14_15220 [Paenibacillus sp. CC-CFT747]|nr:hypothetical protein N6H14_15220 [Paenibacillus sp. CC-CFT747]